ncbi:MAG: exonuclease subunit SbcD, partial [Deltaproteobacteria bacterium]|nr:exonuclease subunit SbcD [Deltaproteobacteria bacterium]
MRILHTSDWHLGRLFHGVHLTQDQAHILDQLVDLVRDVQPQVVIISGDIFDRAVPPPEAVDLLDDVLERLVLGLQVPVILIAGNHDSPVRLEFGSRLLARSRLFVRGRVDPAMRPVVLSDESGPVSIWAWPFAEIPEIRQSLGRPDLPDQTAALLAGLEHFRTIQPPGPRTVLVTHAFVAGGQSSESERPLSLGGVDQVPLETLADWNYVALGHLHRPQSFDHGRVHYPGSLLKYSFSEIDHHKSG